MEVESPRRRFRYGLVVAGIVLVTLAVFVGLVASGVFQWSNSTCHGSAAEVAANRHSLRESLATTWIVVGVVPLGCFVFARRRRGRAWPWLVVALACAAVALSQLFTAQPGTWCVF